MTAKINSWQALTAVEIFQELESGEHGLSPDEALKRLKKYGPNSLPEAKADGLAVIFFSQFKSPLIYVLAAAAVVVFLMGDRLDSLIILAILIFNALVGTIQEGRAQNTLLALKQFVKTPATVLRERREFTVTDEEVVPGDVIILREGDKLPADARVIAANGLSVDESSLTGESTPVHKITETLPAGECQTAELKNMVFKGGYVVAGNGQAIVTATGLKTVIGKISKQIAAIDTEIPLRADIRGLSRLIIYLVAGVSLSLFFLGVFLGKPVKEMFATVVALSVSVIPEGLPIVLTLVLATGVSRLSRRQALVKKLQAVEALGQTRILAVDKTGTVTKNEMVVRKIFTDGKFFEVGGVGYELKGEISLDGRVIDPLNHPELLFAGRAGAYCANSRLIFSEADPAGRVIGDPTEAALLVLAEKIGFSKDDLERESPKLAELPFSYQTKYHAVLHRDNGQSLLTVVGAPEVVLELCETIRRGGQSQVLTAEEKIKLEEIFLELSGQGLRVVALASRRPTGNALTENEVKGLTFAGFYAMKDALRSEVKEAVKAAEAAGIRVVMITGDHKVTARAIAEEAGIFHPAGDEILTGREIDELNDRQLAAKLDRVSVFARVTPEHKLRIIRAYKQKGEIVAMTGDGVNDAPSLVAADLGVAMGRIGTEVAKEASDIVILDDNFTTIMAAVEEGRSIYRTIKKVILYLLSTGLGETLVISGAFFLGLPLPLLPAQIIWLNFITDGFLDVGLAMEPKEKGLLKGYFGRKNKALLDSLMFKRMAVMAIPMMIGSLYLFRQAYLAEGLVKALTVSLTVLAVFQWFNAWNCRSEEQSVFRMNPLANKYLLAATVIVVSLQLLAVYQPLGQRLLHTTALSGHDWLRILPVAASIIAVEEIRKWFYRRRRNKF